MAETQTQEAIVEAVESSVTQTWTVELYELNGKCYISGTSDADWRPKKARLAIYKGSPPSDPKDNETSKSWVNGDSPWNTGEDWGSGWSAAMYAWDGNGESNGNPLYVVKTAVT